MTNSFCVSFVCFAFSSGFGGSEQCNGTLRQDHGRLNFEKTNGAVCVRECLRLHNSSLIAKNLVLGETWPRPFFRILLRGQLRNLRAGLPFILKMRAESVDRSVECLIQLATIQGEEGFSSRLRPTIIFTARPSPSESKWTKAQIKLSCYRLNAARLVLRAQAKPFK